MNRRVLLVDVDPEFQDTLTKQLGRYRVIVMTEPDAERALALGQADPPDLVIIAVEEPDKGGFKTFQKFRKALQMPIILITASLSGEAFAKHRSLKTHANDYLDKRGLSNEELIGKIDNLIGLGDLQDADDIEIPVEEDIPMEIAEGDVVLDEQVDDDPHGSFEHEMATVGPNNGIGMDAFLDAETDAAFASLLGGDEEPAPAKKTARPLPGVAPIEEPVAAAATPAAPADDDVEPVEVEGDHPEEVTAIPEEVPEPSHEPVPMAVEAVAPEDSGIPEPVPHKIPDDEPAEEEGVVQKQLLDMQSVPARIDDGGMPSNVYSPVEDDANNDFGEETMHGSGLPSATTELADDNVASDVESDVASDVESDVASDVAEEEVAMASPGDVSLPAIPIDDDELVSLDDEIPVETEEPDAAPEQPTIAAAPVVADEPRRAERQTVAPVAAEPRAAEPRAGRKTNPPDLGLDDIAKRAESEQSGVYDRKGLRKIDELERQITQLKTELDRARASADTAAKGGREAQFLNLREQSLAKDKEIKQLRASSEQAAKDLAEAQEKLRQAQHAKQTLETKNSQLEERLLDDGGKVKELSAQLEATKAKASQLEADLDAKSKAAMSAETALAQAEKDLASERANRAASASEAERTLRSEREQLVIRHKGELAALRAEAEATQENALIRLREDLEATFATKLAAAVEEARRAAADEHGEAVDALTKTHNNQLVELKAAHAGELSRASAKHAELEGAIAEARSGATAAIAAARDAHDEELEALKSVHAQQIQQLQQQVEQAQHAAQAQINELKQEHAAQIEQLAGEHDAAQADAAKERERMSQQYATQLEQMKTQHASQVQQLQQQLDQTQRDSAAKIAQLEQQHAAQVQQLQQHAAQLEQQHASQVQLLQQQLEQLQREHASTVEQLQQQHAAAIDAMQDEHAEQHERNAEAHGQALSQLKAQLEAQLLEQQHKYEAQLRDAHETAQREISEVRGAAAAAKKAAEEAAARHQAEREDLQQAHASAIGELEAKHERAIAVINGEALKAKAIAETERAKERDALKAEHERAIAELTNEKNELQKGLSGARDALKRTEGELASAVQTIADRNADLRAHQTAIADRDQRITELRGEIESLEAENANYQDQVLRAYQKIKSDEAMVARARKAMAIALTVLDDQGVPTDKPPTS